MININFNKDLIRDFFNKVINKITGEDINEFNIESYSDLIAYIIFAIIGLFIIILIIGLLLLGLLLGSIAYPIWLVFNLIKLIITDIAMFIFGNNKHSDNDITTNI